MAYNKEKKRVYLEKNKDRIAVYKKQYREKNRERYKIVHREYMRKKRAKMKELGIKYPSKKYSEDSERKKKTEKKSSEMLTDRYVVKNISNNTGLSASQIRLYPEIIELERTRLLTIRIIKKQKL